MAERILKLSPESRGRRDVIDCDVHPTSEEEVMAHAIPYLLCTKDKPAMTVVANLTRETQTSNNTS